MIENRGGGKHIIIEAMREKRGGKGQQRLILKLSKIAL
jgi:hypothetical protein